MSWLGAGVRTVEAAEGASGEGAIIRPQNGTLTLNDGSTLALGQTPARPRGGRAAKGMTPTGGGQPPGRDRLSVLRDRAWTADAAMNVADRLLAKADTHTPSFVHVVSVSVQGGPEADLRRVWYLCLAAAFGRYRNRVGGYQSPELKATWDITGKACSVTIGYENSGFIDSAWQNNAGTFNPEGVGGGLALIQRGPDQVTIGGGWPAFTTVTAQKAAGTGVVGGAIQTVNPAIAAVGGGATAAAVSLSILTAWVAALSSPLSGASPWSAVVPVCNTSTPVPYQIFGGWFGRAVSLFREVPRSNLGILTLPWRQVAPGGFNGNRLAVMGKDMQPPRLPDTGRLITTGERFDPRVQNPRPPIDGLSRGSVVSLVAQALSQPCYLPKAPPCPGPLGSQGFFVPTDVEESLTRNGGAVTREVDKPLELVASQSLIATLFTPINLGPDGYPLPPTANLIPNLRR